MMADLKRLPLNGYTVISTFSGCGGSSLGYKLAGFDVGAALEFDKEAADTYEANFPNTPVLRKDIRETSGAELLAAAKLKPGEVDVLDGSPPCASFSTAGKREKGWGKEGKYSGTKQRMDDLFWEYARILDELRPRAFVAENVSGLLKGPAVGYFNEIRELLCSKGYRVRCQLLDAALLGVPQKRERLFFIGLRDDLDIEPPFPQPFPQPFQTSPRTLRQALDGLVGVIEKETWERSTAVAYLLRFMKPGMTGNEVIKGILRGGIPMPALSDGDFVEKWLRKMPGENAYFSLVRLRWDEPVPTVQASHGPRGVATSHIHPDEDRKLSIAELKRVGTFPDDFILTGDFAQQWERIGRAVPPRMLFAIASRLAVAFNSLQQRGCAREAR
jgi:DNA (cytosine-5)-methyltransferase 1